MAEEVIDDEPAPEEQTEEQTEAIRPPVLELRNVSIRGRLENEVRLTGATLQLRAGELAIVTLDGSMRPRETASMLQGLKSPIEGEVLFCGQDWLGEDYDEHFKMRSRIGRVFDGQAWIENLNVDENVTLSRRHHGDSAAAIRDDVRYWLSYFEMDCLSRRRPAFVEPSILQIHQWIRAFLGSPAMIILERPMQFLSSGWVAKLVAAITELRSRGAAVLWFTSHRDWETIGPAQPTLWQTLKGDRLQSFHGGTNDG